MAITRDKIGLDVTALQCPKKCCWFAVVIGSYCDSDFSFESKTAFDTEELALDYGVEQLRMPQSELSLGVAQRLSQIVGARVTTGVALRAIEGGKA